MSNQLNTYGQFLAQAYDLDPGAVHSWIWWGTPAENGRAACITVKPFPNGNGYPGEKIIEVMNYSEEATDDGSRRIFFDVKNVGSSSVLAYAMYGSWTDVMQ